MDPDHESREDQHSLDELLKLVDRLPFVSALKRDAQTLRRLVYARRAARLAVLGRRGSGKSSLLNVLIGHAALPVAPEKNAAAGRWVRVAAGGKRVDWLELPLGTHEAERATVRRAIEEMTPDGVLVVATPSEVEEGLRDVFEALDMLTSLYERLRLGKPNLFFVLTHADRMPGGRDVDGEPSAEQRIAIDLETQRFRGLVREKGFAASEVHPISTRGLLSGFGIERLSERLVRAFPEEAKLEAARAFVYARQPKRELAHAVVHSCAALAMTVALSPIPLSDAVFIAPLQVLMVSTLAHLGGAEWNRKAVAQWIAGLGVTGGAGLGFRWTAQQLVKLVPGAGSVVSAAIAGAGTVAIGRSALAYFVEGMHDRKRALTW